MKKILGVVLAFGLVCTLLGAAYGQCEHDSDHDGDVDGKDLGVFIDSFVIGGGDEIDISGISSELGRTECNSDIDNGLFSPLFTLLPDATFIDTPTDVVFSIGLDMSIGTPIAADLLEVDAQGAVLNVLGNLVDNGDPASGDVFANDRVFSYIENLQSPSETTSYYRARISYDPGDGVVTLLSRISSFCVYPELTDERYQEIHDQIIWAAEQFGDLNDIMPLSEASAQMVEILNSDPAYTNVGIAGSGEGVSWTTVDGYPCFAIVHPDEIVSGTSASPIASYSASSEERHDGANVDQRDMQVLARVPWPNEKPVGNRKVLILDPFFDHMGDVNWLFREGPGPEYEVDYLTGSACNLEAFKRMKDYGIVIISSHGSTINQLNPDRTRDVAIVTGHLQIPADKHLFVEWRQGILATGAVDIGLPIQRVFWSIRPGFVTKYCQGMPDSLVFVAACHSLEENTMADAFRKSGAKVYYGMSKSYAIVWSPLLATELFTEMLNGDNSWMVYDPVRIDPWYPDNRLEMRGGGFEGTDPISITMGAYEVTPISFPSIDDGWPAEVVKSRAADINNNGEVCGQWWPQPEPEAPLPNVRGFYWNTRSDPPVVEDLGELVSIPGLRPEAINDDGIIIGTEIRDYNTNVMRWDPTADPKLSRVDLGEDRPYSGIHSKWAYDVNNAGQIAGTIRYYLSGSPYLHTRAFLYSDTGGFLELGTFSHDPLALIKSEAYGINKVGTVVGYSQFAAYGNARAFVYCGGMAELSIPAEFDSNTATAINDFGMIVGGAWGNSKSAAGYWDPPSMQFHGLAHVRNSDGWPRSEALDVNDKYTILGKSVLPDSASYAYVIWTREDGETYATKLSSLVDWPGWHYIVEGAAINNDGQIAATANMGFGTNDHAVIFTKRDPQN